MPEPFPQNNDLHMILQNLGEMRGESRANFNTLFDSLNQRRSDIKRVEDRSSEQVRQLEQHINTRLSEHDARILVLESDNKKQIAAIAKNSALGGGIAAVLVSAAVELIKRL